MKVKNKVNVKAKVNIKGQGEGEVGVEGECQDCVSAVVEGTVWCIVIVH